MRLIGFDYRPAGDGNGVALLELTARSDRDEGIPEDVTLVISHDRYRRHCAGKLRRAQLVAIESTADDELQWVVGFLAPSRIVSAAPADYQLYAPGQAPITLPEPREKAAR